MMRLPDFRYRAPRTIEEAAWLAENPADTMLLGGGTDLLPNMKRRHQTPSTLVALRGIKELRAIENGDGLRVGAGVTLSRVVADQKVRDAYRGLLRRSSRSEYGSLGAAASCIARAKASGDMSFAVEDAKARARRG